MGKRIGMIFAIMPGRIKKLSGGKNEKAFFDQYSDGLNYLGWLY